MPAADPSDLYGLPLDCFVAERGALAKALRAAGDKDEAARVAALRKPSVAAWTVNQLMRTQTSAAAALFGAGDELQRAQSELLAGRGDASAMREASRRERDAVDELSALARGLLSSDGHEPTQATLDRVSDTLHAAALDEDARRQMRDGCLDRELRQVGFGGSGGGGAPVAAGLPRGRGRASGASAGSAAAPERKRDPARPRAEREQAKREAAAAARAERERAERLKSARKAEVAAGRLAERAARECNTAEERRDHAALSLRDAEAALVAARGRYEEAALAHRRAQAALEDV